MLVAEKPLAIVQVSTVARTFHDKDRSSWGFKSGRPHQETHTQITNTATTVQITTPAPADPTTTGGLLALRDLDSISQAGYE